MIQPLPDLLIEPTVRAALAEDLGRAGDITAQACIDADAVMSVVFATRQSGVVAGLACARLAILALDPKASFGAVVKTWLITISLDFAGPKKKATACPPWLSHH